MFRTMFRGLLLVYFVLPIVGGFFVISTFVQIRDQVAPVYESASVTISKATTALDHLLRNLKNDLAPLAEAVNATGTALQSVVKFIEDTVFALIRAVNSINPACFGFSHKGCIPISFDIKLPKLIDLSFINNISASITDISTQMNNVVTKTTTTINSYVTMLTIAAIVFVVWMLLTYVLFVISIFTGLWRL